jgi:hypothetical protein
MHWGWHGRTDLRNLVLLCHRHHWMAHEGGWQVVLTDGQDFHAVPPIPPGLPRPREPGLAPAA